MAPVAARCGDLFFGSLLPFSRPSPTIAMDAPTPCPELPVEALIDHEGGFAKVFTASAKEEIGDFTAQPPDPRQGTWNPAGALDTVAESNGTLTAAVALAWLAAQPTVAAPLASARTPSQLQDLLQAPGLRLTPDDLTLLMAASGARQPVSARDRT